MTQTFTRAALSLLALVLLTGAAVAQDPGLPYPADSEASDQKAGSVLFYNAYTSDPTNPSAADTRVNITNINSQFSVAVHLFFVNAANCQVADSFICLTENQTASFLTSDLDPGTSGYIVAVASFSDGTPRLFNFLIGDEYVKYASGHTANLGAVAFSKLSPANIISSDGTLALLVFDGLNLSGSYNRAPRVVAVDNIPSRADGNDTLLILNAVSGNLGTTAGSLGPLFGILYDDAETPLSFTSVGGCQFRQSINNNFPRTAPRVETHIPSGRSGWLKINATTNVVGVLGAVINRGDGDAAFDGGHNLHHLTLMNVATLSIPLFPSNCPDDGVLR
jgi:hypothetical protein